MKNKVVYQTLLFLMFACSLHAQTEAVDPYPGDQSRWSQVKSTKLLWGSIDERYPRQQPAEGTVKPLSLSAWRGERINAQAVVVAPKAIGQVSVAVDPLKSSKGTLAADCVKVFEVAYVLTDNFSRNDSALVADRLVPTSTFTVPGQTTRPVWYEISIPQSAKAGLYKTTVRVNCDGKAFRLPLTVQVVDRVLPEPKDWKFHLDLWQNPYAVARYFDVPLWSDAHFEKMRPLMKMLADAGQKVLTCSIIQHPWNSQTYTPFESMIGKTKTLEGTWKYDYTVFDKWVEFMMGLGIDKQIDCYTLIPWHAQFDYYDMATNSVKYVKSAPGTQVYDDFILPFLRDFAAHLKAKGWFSRTCIAMDERPTDQLRAAYATMKRADADYRIEGAYNYFPDVVDYVHDISVLLEYSVLDDNIVERRHAAGQPVTFYTCCAPERPNTFTFSPPAEAAFMGWHAAAVNYDGYLRWAYNGWMKDPNYDSRFGWWPGGDCYLVYPDGPSIRFQRLVEGIQAYEKLRLLKENGDEATRQQIKKALEPLTVTQLTGEENMGEMIRQAQKAIPGW